MIVVPIPYTTPDGADREIRFSQGAKRRLALKFGRDKQMEDIMREHGDDAIVEVAYLMMHDAAGKPPADLTLEQFFESLPPQGINSLLAAVMSAVTQGSSPKNELEVLLMEAEKLMESRKRNEILKTIGSGSGPSQRSASESMTPISGGNTPPESSTPESSDTANKSDIAQS